MALKTTPVNKSLDKKLMIFGFELIEVLVIFILLSVLNLLFGATPFALALVWFPPLILGLVIRIYKTGKPDNYLLHMLRYKFSPGFYPAFDKEAP